MKQEPVDLPTNLIDLDSYGDWITPSSIKIANKSDLIPTPPDLYKQKDSISDGREVPAERNLVLEQIDRLEKEFQSMNKTITSLYVNKLKDIEILLHKLSDKLQTVVNVLGRKPDQSSKKLVSEVMREDTLSMSTSTDTMAPKHVETKEERRFDPETKESTKLQNRNDPNGIDKSLNKPFPNKLFNDFLSPVAKEVIICS